MAALTSSRILRTALFVLVPAAYLSMVLWRPSDSYRPAGHAGISSVCVVLMPAVLVVSVLSWNTHRLVAFFGLLAGFGWLAVTLLPVL
jgi:hypothetical protein